MLKPHLDVIALNELRFGKFTTGDSLDRRKVSPIDFVVLTSSLRLPFISGEGAMLEPHALPVRL